MRDREKTGELLRRPPPSFISLSTKGVERDRPGVGQTQQRAWPAEEKNPFKEKKITAPSFASREKPCYGGDWVEKKLPLPSPDPG